MGKMAQAKDKNLTTLLLVGFLIIVAVVVAILLVNRGGRTAIPDEVTTEFMTSDEQKLAQTVTVEDGMTSFYGEFQAHYFYYYIDDKVISLMVYREFTSPEEAAAALETAKTAAADDSTIVSVTLKDQYLVFEMAESEFNDRTATEVKESIEFFESIKANQ